MPQAPIPNTLYVSKIEVGDGLAIDPPSGTGIVTINLAGAAQEIVNTAITTVGDGLLTAAALAGTIITRSGSIAAYSDTTDTAVAIVAALASAFAGQSFLVEIKNTVPFAETIVGGVGVTITGPAIIPPNSVGKYLLTIVSLTAVTLLHIDTVPLSSNVLEVNTTLTTNGAGTITGAGIAGGITTRSGATAAFTDTTDTAAHIITARVNAHIGDSWEYTYKNTVPFLGTLAGGVGVTLSGIGSASVAPNSWVKFLVTYTAAATITMVGVSVGPTSMPPLEVATALTTVGAGTITGAGIAGGVVVRTGPTAVFTDTTDTADNIIAARPNAHIGDAWEVTYRNTVAFLATLAGGAGVTVSVITLVPGQSTARFLVTYTAASTVTMVGIGLSPNISLPPYKFSSQNATAGALAAGAITGAAMTVLANTNATPGNQQVRTAAQMLADIPGGYVGLTVGFRIVNTGAGTLTLIADGGATVTLTGTMATITNTFRDYTLTFVTATTATIQSVGSGVSP